MEILEYVFMRWTFTVGVPLATVILCIRFVIVCRHLSMTKDTLSHTSLAGVAAGLVLGLNPILTAATACVITAIGIEAICREIPRLPEISIAVIMSAGIDLAGILLGSVKNAASLNSFLSGNIVVISNGESYLVIAVSMAVLFMFLLMYKELLYVSLDRQSTRLAGVSVETVSFLFTILVTATVFVTARTTGALTASSMMVAPVAYAMQLGTSCRRTLTFAVAFSILFMITDLFAAYYLGLKPGGTIILVGVMFLILVFAGKKILKRR